MSLDVSWSQGQGLPCNNYLARGTISVLHKNIVTPSGVFLIYLLTAKNAVTINFTLWILIQSHSFDLFITVCLASGHGKFLSYKNVISHSSAT